MPHAYPSLPHAAAAAAITAFFSAQPGVCNVLLTNSCARGRATRDSCLDILVLVRPEVDGALLEQSWSRFHEGAPEFAALHAVGRFSEVHLDLADGRFAPRERGWTSGPDPFEIELGNYLVYAVPLWTCPADDYWSQLREAWLPYYGDDLRTERLAGALKYLHNDLDHIDLYVPRGLHFQSLNRLHCAFREFLQALFIARRVYPIAYDKWIREQLVEILGEPDLYRQCVQVLTVAQLEGDELIHKADHLRRLAAQFLDRP